MTVVGMVAAGSQLPGIPQLRFKTLAASKRQATWLDRGEIGCEMKANKPSHLDCVSADVVAVS